MSKIEEFMENLIHYAPIDDIMDKIAKENVHSSLPPCLTEGMDGAVILCIYVLWCIFQFGTGEKRCSVAVRGSEWSDEDGLGKGFEFTGETEVKLARYNAVRQVTSHSTL